MDSRGTADFRRSHVRMCDPSGSHSPPPLQFALLFGLAVAQQCPTDLSRVLTVPEGNIRVRRCLLQLPSPSLISRGAAPHTGCPCNPITRVGFGLCQAGYVCAEPWAGNFLSQAAAAPGRPLALPPVHPESGSTSQAVPAPFICQSCAYGQYCPQGSVLPAASSPLIQL